MFTDLFYDKLANLYHQDGNAPTGSNSPASLSKKISTDSFDLAGCSHTRSVLLFADSILNGTCTMTAYECDNYDLFLEDDAGCADCQSWDKCTRIGYYCNAAIAQQKRIKKFYTATKATEPYCANFKVQFTLKEKSPSEPENDPATGSIYFTITGSRGTTGQVLASKPEFIDLTPGKSYSFFPEVSKELGDLQSITLLWKVKSNDILGHHTKTDYIFLDGHITAIDQNNMVNIFTPSQEKVTSSKDMIATFTRRQDL